MPRVFQKLLAVAGIMVPGRSICRPEPSRRFEILASWSTLDFNSRNGTGFNEAAAFARVQRIVLTGSNLSRMDNHQTARVSATNKQANSCDFSRRQRRQ